MYLKLHYTIFTFYFQYMEYKILNNSKNTTIVNEEYTYSFLHCLKMCLKSHNKPHNGNILSVSPIFPYYSPATQQILTESDKKSTLKHVRGIHYQLPTQLLVNLGIIFFPHMFWLLIIAIYKEIIST